MNKMYIRIGFVNKYYNKIDYYYTEIKYNNQLNDTRIQNIISKDIVADLK